MDQESIVSDLMRGLEFSQLSLSLHRVHSVVCLINIPTNAHMLFNNLKYALKHIKRFYMFRSRDHPQGAYIVPC